jgi:hypothetical protein
MSYCRRLTTKHAQLCATVGWLIAVAGGGCADRSHAGSANSNDAAAFDASASVSPDGSADASITAEGGAPPRAAVSVLQRHKNATRDGHFVDARLTRAAVRAAHADAAFVAASLQGPIFAQPLYAENGATGRKTIFVATEQDVVYALDATSGAIIWQKAIGTPVPQPRFECANIDPVGITGTPVIDMDSRTLLVNAMHSDDGGTTKRHMLFALSIDDGTVRRGYPVDLVAKLAAKGVAFNPAYEQQRGGLTLMQNRVYIPFGAYAGDCGDYHGFVVGVPIENPNQVYEWHVPGRMGGIWGPGGPATDGTALYVATGNTDTRVVDWSGGDAVIKLGPGPTFSGDTHDWFTPSNWRDLDQADLELGASQPILVDMPGAAHPHLVVQFAKNGNVYLLDRSNLGGLGRGNGTTGEGLVSARIATNYIINAAAAYTTASGQYVAVKAAGVGCPTGSDLMAIKIGAGDPPAISTAWCATANSEGSPVVTTTDGSSEPIVWTAGADGNGKLSAFDGETGELLFASGDETISPIARLQSPIVADGRAIWVSNERLFAYTVR